MLSEFMTTRGAGDDSDAFAPRQSTHREPVRSSGWPLQKVPVIGEVSAFGGSGSGNIIVEVSDQ